MLARLGLCVLFSIYANVTDWKERKVRNQAVILFCLTGLIVNLGMGGIRAAASALLGGAVMLCLFPLFALRMLGAGDVKAMIAIGCMLGFPVAGEALLASILGGGIVALCVLLIRRDGWARLLYLLRYLQICLLSRSVPPYGEQTGAEGGFRFTFGITIGLLALLFRELWQCFT